MIEIKDWAKLVREYPVAFGIENGFEDLVDIHNEWIKSFLFEEGDYTLQAHRGSYKTTCLSIAMALLVVIHPNTPIIFMRKTDTDVRSIMKQVSKLLVTPIFQSMAMDVYGTSIELETESVLEIDTNLHTTATGAPQLSALSIGSSLTGQHADIVITDDIVTLRDRISGAERKRTKSIYQELQNIKNRGGRIINTGTPWHKDDAFQLMGNIDKFDVSSTGLLSGKEQQSLRDSMTSSLYAANYELKHIADEDALFTNVQIDDGSNTHLVENGVCHIDASYGGADGTAFTILKEQPCGRVYVYGELKQDHVDNVLDGFEQKRKHYKAGTMYSETNADKGYLNKKIESPKQTYHESMNKYIKISTHLKGRWDDIVFIKDTDPEYINQILDYTENSSHDDAPDSLASLIREAVSKNTAVEFLK